MKTSNKSITGNQAVSLQSFPLFRSAVPVGRTSLHFTDTQQSVPIKTSAFYNKTLIITLVNNYTTSHIMLFIIGKTSNEIY
jgi:hypothetical protein